MSEYDNLPPDLEPIDNHILFQFEDEVDEKRRSTFKEKTDWGFEIRGDIDTTTEGARWIYIIGLGPEAIEEGFTIGQKVLVGPLRWSKRCEYKGVKFNRTDIDQILAVEEPA